MKKITLAKIIGISIILGIVSFGISYVTTERSAPQKENTPITASAGRISLVIDGFSVATSSTALTSEQTALAVLEKLNTEYPDLRLSVKTYEGLGTLVESMAGKTNGDDGKYWHYTVNGVLPQIGADQYQLSDKDVVEWRFKDSEF